MIDTVKIIALIIIIIKVLYTLIGIGYEWITRKKIKGFTLNLLASGLLFVLWFTIPYQLYLRHKRRKIGTVLDELVLHEYEKAASRDQTGNVVHHTILNKFLIAPNGYKCGDKDETVSGVLGVNEILRYIANPLGSKLVKLLNRIEQDHCYISIDEGDIRWKDLNEGDKMLLATALKSKSNK